MWITLLINLNHLNAVHVGQGTDGNPHGWDRQRRCDSVAYDPPCGVCEGFGGIPWGDDNDQITLTSCRPAQEQTKNPKPPVWASEMTIDPYFSVQIGPKVDPFCFAAIPSNSSAGKLCYQNQTGSQSYDFENSKSLLFDIDLHTAFGKVHSVVTAQGPFLWIVNYFPWYLLGLRQCICTNPTEGGSAGAPVYPLNPKWTAVLAHVGTEVVGVEYVDAEMTLDHWAYGPHHVWTAPDSGSIIRMWQPYNGLQVLPNGTLRGTSSSVVSPPPECTSSLAIKINCNESGYPTVDEKTYARAVKKVPAPSYRSQQYDILSPKLNAHLLKYNASACDEWTTEEIHDLQMLLLNLRSQVLQEVYADASDRRSIDIQRRKLLVDECRDWGDCDVLRDGHCHEAVMWIVHHLDASSQKYIIQRQQPIPMLPLVKHECDFNCSPSFDLYKAQVSCMDCHAI